MAAAVLAKFRTKMFDTSLDLHTFVTQDDSPVNSITSIVFDGASGKFILFYMVA